MTTFSFIFQGRLALVEQRDSRLGTTLDVRWGGELATYVWDDVDGESTWDDKHVGMAPDRMRPVLRAAANRCASIVGVSALCLMEHDALVGKVALAHSVEVFIGDNQQEVQFRPPLAVKVLPMGDDALLGSSRGGWHDPVWDVECLDPGHPSIPEGWRVSWMFGTSRNENGEAEPQPYIVLEGP